MELRQKKKKQLDWTQDLRIESLCSLPLVRFRWPPSHAVRSQVHLLRWGTVVCFLIFSLSSSILNLGFVIWVSFVCLPLWTLLLQHSPQLWDINIKIVFKFFVFVCLFVCVICVFDHWFWIILLRKAGIWYMFWDYCWSEPRDVSLARGLVSYFLVIPLSSIHNNTIPF